MNDGPSKSDDSPTGPPEERRPKPSLLAWIKGLGRTRSGEASVRTTLDELIEEREEASVPLNDDERRLLANILDLRTRTVYDLMVPRADIVSAEASSSLADVIGTMTKAGHSRLPVYRETLDDVIGMVHIKDVLAFRGRDHEFQLPSIMRKVLFVSPSMQVLELLLEMRVKRIHMALVVDEFGGIDGLVTIEDLVEEIVGEIEDEHDDAPEALLVPLEGGMWDADARVELEDVAEKIDPRLAEVEEAVDTLGGLAFVLAEQVPQVGTILEHESGWRIEVTAGNERHVTRLRLHPPGESDDSET